MKSFSKKLALILATAMLLSTFAACGEKAPAATDTTSTETSTEVSTSEEAPAASEDAPAVETAPEEEKTLVVGMDTFSSKFSPFFSTTQYDQNVWGMTAISMLNSDREGNVVTKGREGEVRAFNGTDYTYFALSDLDVVVNDDGTTDYTFQMRDDVKFSDGTPVTADDAIFSLYVYLDPTYDGSTTLYALPIAGLDEYRSGMDTLFNLLIAAGKDNTDFSLWDEATQTAFWADLEQAGAAFVQEIIDYCVAAGYGAAEDSPATVIENWGFEAPEEATTTDIFYIMCEAYGNDVAAMSDTESAGSSIFDLMENYAAYTSGVETGESAANVSGIVKNDDHSLTIKLTEVDATAIYQMDFPVAPLSYYGDTASYDYANNKFGFTKGDLSIVKDKTTKPMGAGAYKFVSFENGVVTFEANENYYLGAPVTKYVQFKETPASDKLTGVTAGTFDVTDPNMNLETLKNIKSYNSNGEVNGDVLSTQFVDNLGYGYIGISAHNVCVGGDSDSDASKSLRKAFATLFACYRDTVINSYYGEMASVIQYPISNTSWAAPKPADEGYRLAYSVNADGEQIYTADMTDEQKAAAAIEAAVSFLKAAGYTFDEATGVFTAAPEGAKLTYEAIIPADGIGDHPAYGILTATKEALAPYGITLEINDPADSNILWDKLDADTADMWCAAWGATVDPDMYQVYHSSNYNQNTMSNHYAITSDELDELIVAARTSIDQSYRKATYKQCLDIILDWAVEVPTYQRQNAYLFSSERINLDSITPDITTYWSWMREVEKIEMK